MIILQCQLQCNPQRNTTKRYRAVFDPESNVTWAQHKRTTERWLASKRITPTQATEYTRLFKAIGSAGHRIISGNCFNEQGYFTAQGSCSKYKELYKLSEGYYRWNVKPNIDNGGGTGGGVSGRKVVCSTGRHYFIKGNTYWQQTQRDRLRTCPDNAFSSKHYGGWRWDNAGRDKANGGGSTGGSTTSGSSGGAAGHKVVCSTGRHYFIKGNTYWQQTQRDRLRTCPDNAFSSKHYGGWRWDNAGRDKAA